MITQAVIWYISLELSYYSNPIAYCVQSLLIPHGLWAICVPRPLPHRTHQQCGRSVKTLLHHTDYFCSVQIFLCAAVLTKDYNRIPHQPVRTTIFFPQPPWAKKINSPGRFLLFSAMLCQLFRKHFFTVAKTSGFFEAQWTTGFL